MPRSSHRKGRRTGRGRTAHRPVLVPFRDTHLEARRPAEWSLEALAAFTDGRPVAALRAALGDSYQDFRRSNPTAGEVNDVIAALDAVLRASQRTPRRAA